MSFLFLPEPLIFTIWSIKLSLLISRYDPIQAWVLSNNVSPAWTEEDEMTVAIPPGVSPFAVYSGAGETPEERSPPDLAGDAAITGDFMQCSGGSGSNGSLTCLSLASVAYTDPALDYDDDGENAAANLEDALLERADLSFTRTVPFWDIFQLIKPKGTRTKELAPRSTGTARPFTVTGPSGIGFTTRSSEYITGNSGQILVGANPNAGYMNLEDANDCIRAVITDSAAPSRDLASEHLLEQNLVALGWQFVMTGYAPPTTQMLEYRTQATRFGGRIAPEALMGANSVFRQPWNTWDPTGAGYHVDATLSPEREMWDAIGSIAHPEYLVNLQQVINAFKSRMMRGISGIGTDRWNRLDWDDTSEATGRASASRALSQLRLFMAVINYLNHPTAHVPFMASMNRISDIMGQFDDAVARNNLNAGVRTYAGPLWREFIHAVVIARTQATQREYLRWLQRMRSNWVAERRRAIAANAPPSRIQDIQGIISDIGNMLSNPNSFTVNITGLFANPVLP